MTITEEMFFDEFTHQGLKDRFSRSGLAALYRHLEEMNQLERCGVHELCRQYREYACLEDLCEEYKQEYNSLKDLEAKTNMTVIRLLDEGFIIRRY